MVYDKHHQCSPASYAQLMSRDRDCGYHRNTGNVRNEYLLGINQRVFEMRDTTSCPLISWHISACLETFGKK